ncbi:MAG: TolC family protein [Elusimicrobiota bacterium]
MRKMKISKEDIIKKALELMAENGPDSVSMREIAQKLSVTKPMIYYHFKDKEDLIKQVFFSKAKELEEIKFDTDKNLSVEDIVYAIVKKYYDFLNSNPEAVKCVMKIFDAPEESPIRKYALQMREKNKEKVKEVLNRLAAEGKIDKKEIDYIIHMISALLSYQIFEMRVSNNLISLDLLKKLSKIAAYGVKKINAVFLLALLSLPISVFSQISAEDAVNMAMSKNVSVLNALETQEIYSQKIREYWGGVYPNISLSASYSRNIEKQSLFFNGNKIEMGLDNSYSGSLDLSQILWAGGKVGTGIEMAEIYADSASENLSSAKKTIKKIVKQTYYAAALMREMLNIQKENLDISKQHLETIKQQYEKGLKSDLEVMRQEVEVSNNEPSLIKAENAYEQSLLALKNVIGMDPDEKIELSSGPLCSNPGEFEESRLYDLALKNRADYKLAVLNLSLAQKQLRLEKAGHWPNLTAFASRAFSGQSDSGFPDSSQRSWSLTAGVKFNMPIFSGFSVSSRVKQAEGSVKIAERNLKDLKRKIKIDVKSSFLDLKEAQRRLLSQKTSVDTARKALQVTESRFKNGLASRLELNDAALALNKAETLAVQAEYDYCGNMAKLDWEIGN